MKVLITHSYFLRFDPKQWKQMQPYPPLSTLLSASILRDKGYKVHFVDTMFMQGPGELATALNEFTPDVVAIVDDGFNYLTKMCLTNMRDAAFEMIRLARKAGATVIVSSSDSTDHAQKYHETGAQYIIHGEVEESLCELLSVLDSKENAEQIKGVSYYAVGKVVHNPSRAVMKDLDKLPLPAWDLADINRYKNAWLQSSGYFSLNIATTRGCPYKCNWCAKPIYGNRYNSRSPAHVVQEIRLLKKEYEIDHIWFCDDIFGLKPGWIREFASILKQEGIIVSYKIQSRADLLADEETVEALADSGCTSVWMGAESGSQKILDAMDKGVTIEEICTATASLKQRNIKACFFLQLGYPGENADDIRATIKLLDTLKPDDIGLSVSYPLPGTKFFERVKSELKAKTNWSDSDDLSVMFRHDFSSAFYKQLHKYIHKSFRKKQAITSLRSLSVKSSRSQIRSALSLLYYIPSAFIERNKLNSFRHETGLHV